MLSFVNGLVHGCPYPADCSFSKRDGNWQMMSHRAGNTARKITTDFVASRYRAGLVYVNTLHVSRATEGLLHSGMDTHFDLRETRAICEHSTTTDQMIPLY